MTRTKSEPARISSRSPGSITFEVDPVAPATDLLPLRNARSRHLGPEHRLYQIFSHDETFEIVADTWNHPLVDAVHLASSQHRPLVLTPDMIWITLAQGFAHHLNNFPEALRPHFAEHKGRLTLLVNQERLTHREDWAQVFEGWATHNPYCDRPRRVQPHAV